MLRQRESQRDSYVALVKDLEARGYVNFWLFDNFGGLARQTTGAAGVLEMIDEGLAAARVLARTFDYLDILACRSSDAELIRTVAAPCRRLERTIPCSAVLSGPRPRSLQRVSDADDAFDAAHAVTRRHLA